MAYGLSDTDIYKLMDILTINDGSALIAGVSPTDIYYNDDSYQYDQPPYLIAQYAEKQGNSDLAFEMARKSLIHAVTNGEIQANIITNQSGTYLAKTDLKKDWIAINGIDSHKTTIKRDDLKEWLDKRGVYPSLLFPNGKKDDYMNKNHPHYSPKLAVCVRAWEVAQTADLQGQTVKQFIEQWIKDNGKTFGLSNTGKKLSELASIPNWNVKGGRAKSKPTPPLEATNNDNNTPLTVHRKLEVNLPDTPTNNNSEDIPF